MIPGWVHSQETGYSVTRSFVGVSTKDDNSVLQVCLLECSFLWHQVSKCLFCSVLVRLAFVFCCFVLFCLLLNVCAQMYYVNCINLSCTPIGVSEIKFIVLYCIVYCSDCSASVPVCTTCGDIVLNHLPQSFRSRGDVRHKYVLKRCSAIWYNYYIISAVRESEFNPKTLGSIPWRGRAKNRVFVFCPCESTLVQPCSCLTRLRLRHAPNIRAHVKYPISICRKRVGLTAGDIVSRNHCTQKKSWVAPYHGCSLSPGKAARISRALHWTQGLRIWIWTLQQMSYIPRY